MVGVSGLDGPVYTFIAWHGCYCNLYSPLGWRRNSHLVQMKDATMQCYECKQLRHDGPCEPQPTELDELEAVKDAAFEKQCRLIYILPIVGRTEEQQGQIDEARAAALAARDAYLNAGGK